MPGENCGRHRVIGYDNKVSNNPYKKISSRLVYENPWMKLREDAVTRPNGNPGIFGTVEIGPGASVLAIDREKNIYLVREWKYPLARYTLEVISGGKDGEETFEQCARRELEEEAGLTGGTLMALGLMETITTIVKSQVQLFLATDVEPGVVIPGDDDIMEVVKMPFAEALEKAMSAEFEHAATVITILKAARLLGY